MSNSCYTYFAIVGNFNPDEVTERLNVKPEKKQKKGDKKRDGSEHDSARWECGFCDEYDAAVEKQMEKTVSILADKIDLLNRIREENDVTFYLEIVASVCVGEPAPCLAPSLEVIDFCHATRTKIDLDLYVYDSDCK